MRLNLWSIVPVVVALLVLRLASSAGAQGREVFLDVKKAGSVRHLIAIPPFEGGQTSDRERLAMTLREIVRNDLEISGFFRFLDDEPLLKQLDAADRAAGSVDYNEWLTTGARLVIKGKVQALGNQIRLEALIHDVQNKRMRLKAAYDGDVKLHRTIAHRLSNAVFENLTGEPWIAETTIAFLGYYQGHKEVFMMDYDGFNVDRLTRHRSVILALSWSQDARHLFFTSYRDRNPDLFALSTNGGTSRPFFRYPGINSMAAWSPNGNEVAVVLSKDGNPEIYLAKANGANLRRLTRNRGVDSAPAWAPDGKTIYFTSDRAGTPQIFAMSRNGDDVRRITFSGGFNDLAALSPSGDTIAFTSRVGGAFQIALMNPNGSGMRFLTGGSGSSESPTWAPDGRLLAFSSTRKGRSNVFIIRADGSGLRQITRFNTGAFSPAWSPRVSPP